MNRILAILTIHTDNLPTNFQEIIQHEQAVIAEWKEEGILDHLFLRDTRNGALLVFQNIDESEVKARMEKLPLFPLMKSIEYYNLMKQF